MPEHHARAGVAHHRADLLAACRFVAVHRALGAGGLVLLERALLQPHAGVREQLGAVGTECLRRIFRRPVLVAAVHADHRLEGARLACHPRVGVGEFDTDHGISAPIDASGGWRPRAHCILPCADLFLSDFHRFGETFVVAGEPVVG